jgi:hypothetical protein
MKGLHLLANKLRDIHRLFFIVNIRLPILTHCLIVQFLFIGFEHAVQLLYYLLLVLKELVMDTLPQSHQIVKNFIVSLIQLLENDDMLVALLLRLCNYLLQIHIGRLVVLKEMLLRVLYDTVWT